MRYVEEYKKAMRLRAFAYDQRVIFIMILDTSNGPKSFDLMVTNHNHKIQFNGAVMHQVLSIE